MFGGILGGVLNWNGFITRVLGAFSSMDRRIEWLLLLVLAAALITDAQDAAANQPVCSANQLYNGQICTCAPGYVA